MLKFKVLSYNIHKGYSLFRRRYQLEELKDALRQIQANVILLQEVLGYHPKRKELSDQGFNNQLEYFADEMWPHHAYGKNAVYSSGHHGNAVLTQFPILSWENIDLTTNHWEKRGLLHVKVQPNSEYPVIHFFNVHLNLFEQSRHQQVNYIVNHARDKVKPEDALILGGDFNDWRQTLSEPLLNSQNLKSAYLEKHGCHAKTFPLRRPFLCLDRVYYRGLELIDIHRLHGSPWDGLSDHYPLLAEFKL